jgi:hypothetical protein
MLPDVSKHKMMGPNSAAGRISMRLVRRAGSFSIQPASCFYSSGLQKSHTYTHTHTHIHTHVQLSTQHANVQHILNSAPSHVTKCHKHTGTYSHTHMRCCITRTCSLVAEEHALCSAHPVQTSSCMCSRQVVLLREEPTSCGVLYIYIYI